MGEGDQWLAERKVIISWGSRSIGWWRGATVSGYEDLWCREEDQWMREGSQGLRSGY